MIGKKGSASVLVLVLGLAVILSDGLFVVRVDQFAIVTEFGAPVRVIEAPGLYLKTPAIQQAVFIDRRIMSWDDSPQEVITLDKKRIYINSFARWKVADPLKYYTAVRDEKVAQMNLDKIIGGNIREIVSANLLDTLVRDTNRKLTYTSEDSERERTTVELVQGRGRSAIVKDIVNLSRGELLETFGISIIDVDIKQLNYTQSAQDATIRQMISEREKVAATYEAQGRKEADTIAGETQEQVLALRGSATRERLRIEGEARAESSAIKATAFGQDPEFFSFLQTLELYQTGLVSNTRFYFSTDSSLTRHLLHEEKGVGNVAPQDLKALMEGLREEVELKGLPAIENGQASPESGTAAGQSAEGKGEGVGIPASDQGSAPIPSEK